MAYLSKVRCAQTNALAPAPRLPPRAGPSGAVPSEQTLQLSWVSEPSTSLQLPCPHPLHSGSPSSSAYEPAPPNVVQNDVLYRSVFNRFVEPAPREEPMRAPAGHGSHPVLPFSGCCDPGLHASQAGQPSFLATAGDNARAAAWFRQHTRYAMEASFPGGARALLAERARLARLAISVVDVAGITLEAFLTEPCALGEPAQSFVRS